MNNDSAPQLSSELLRFLEGHDDVKRITVPSGVPVCQSGDICESLFIVLHGQVKVYRPSENGRSLTLYYVGDHESCILTASCILNATPFPAYAKTVTEVEALSIPPQRVIEWLEHKPIWQKYVLSLLSQRMSSLIDLVNALAFKGLDARLSKWLVAQVAMYPHENIQVTHQFVAEELASSREVISRLLKDFEQDGLIELNRGVIKIIDLDALKEGCQ